MELEDHKFSDENIDFAWPSIDKEIIYIECEVDGRDCVISANKQDLEVMLKALD